MLQPYISSCKCQQFCLFVCLLNDPSTAKVIRVNTRCGCSFNVLPMTCVPVLVLCFRACFVRACGRQRIFCHLHVKPDRYAARQAQHPRARRCGIPWAVTHPGTNRGGPCLTSLAETNVVTTTVSNTIHRLPGTMQNWKMQFTAVYSEIRH
jgi:hypothetical protein